MHPPAEKEAHVVLFLHVTFVFKRKQHNDKSAKHGKKRKNTGKNNKIPARQFGTYDNNAKMKTSCFHVILVSYTVGRRNAVT